MGMLAQLRRVELGRGQVLTMIFPSIRWQVTTNLSLTILWKKSDSKCDVNK